MSSALAHHRHFTGIMLMLIQKIGCSFCGHLNMVHPGCQPRIFNFLTAFKGEKA